MEQLVDRAREAGVVRPDGTVEDVRVCLGAVASFRLAHSATDLHRLVELLLIGLAADVRTSPEISARPLRARRQAIP
ncbi:hypothetical protein ACFVGN_43125 [Streptomyces sp. NPDC057757]|uniref:SbtR family transcriptional regulator n=1 Tax=Streptomyces sp. NPDC057757 TaxID=3346241 RepID=UPI0036849E12